MQGQAIGLKEFLALTVSAGSRSDKFVLANGRAFEVTAETYKGVRGKPNHCFMNAAHLAMENEALTYCEGYILCCGVPLEHAWCSTKSGEVIDPTLTSKSVEHVTGYYGVPFKRAYLLASLAKNGYYGLLGLESKTRIKLFEGKAKNFLEEIA